MRKKSEDYQSSRMAEIVSACQKLYETMSFKDITIKEISAYTSFSRPSIYNYFETKEEIFLALFTQEYDRWASELRELMDHYEELPGDALAEKIAESVERHPQMLKLLSMNLYDMEENSRPERLAEFKRAFGSVLLTMRQVICRFRPAFSEADLDVFLYAFFPFMIGIYPYAVVTEKQRAAMEEAGLDYRYHSIYELTDQFLKRVL